MAKGIKKVANSNKKKKTKDNGNSVGGNSNNTESLQIQDGFHVLPLQMPAYNEDVEKPIVHYVYFKQHQMHGSSKLNNDDGDDDNVATLGKHIPEEQRMLFVLNLPVDTTEADIRHWFRDAGAIETIRFKTLQQYEEIYDITAGSSEAEALSKHRLRPLLDAGSYAHVIFLEPLGLQRALSLTARTRRWRDEATSEKSKTQLAIGLERYKLTYQQSRPAPSTLGKQANAYIVAYEEEQRKKQAMESAMYNVPDEDGFITVVRQHRKRGNTDGRGMVKAVRAEDAAKLKEKSVDSKEKVDFYRFQHREAKREKLLDLRRKFEQDKERIAKMRTNRRFKPY